VSYEVGFIFDHLKLKLNSFSIFYCRFPVPNCVEICCLIVSLIQHADGQSGTAKGDTTIRSFI
jgi:hypothetical protein